MSSDTLREQIQRLPFRPITLFLPSGKTVTVHNPELAMFTETGRTLIVAEGERVVLVDVTTIEAAETAAN